MSKYKNAFFIAMTSLLITACGGGDSSSSGSSTNTKAKGEFKYSSITGVVTPDGEMNFNQNACAAGNGYDRYFESENTLVFSNSNRVTDDDYIYAATVVENNFAKVLDAMGLTLLEFQNYRPAYTAEVILRVPDEFYLYGAESLEAGNVLRLDPEQFYGRYQELLDIKQIYWNSLSRAEQMRLAQLFLAGYQKVFAGNMLYENIISKALVPQKVVVCLDITRTNPSFYGEGSIVGIQIAPKSVASRKDSAAVIIHELVHMVQSNVATPDEGAYRLDRWFAEGQAIYIAGQTIAKNNSGYNPTTVVNFYDEDASLVKYPYEHYGLAYSYLAKYNNKSAMINFLKNIRSNPNRFYWDGLTKPTFPAFSAEFEKVLVGADGKPLSLEHFRENYLNLVQ